MATPIPKKPHETPQNPPIFTTADLILPWLTPQELASISTTCKALHNLSKPIAAARSSDASRSFENNLPIPFHNSLNPHPYSYFLYTPTQLLPSPHFRRQFWGPTHPNSKPSIPPQFPPWTAAGSRGCDCGHGCDGGGGGGCPCSVLKGGEVVTECGLSCGCGVECGNRVSQMGVSVMVKVVRVKDKGWGLFADQFVPAGRFVCEYAGELLTTKEAKERQQKYDELSANGLFSAALLVVREHLPSGKACFRINIDATRVGNIARFINHSCDGGNLSTVIVRSSGALLPRVCFFASMDIHKDEELSFSYGDIRQRAEGLRCLCGSSNCFGVLPSENT